jgi:hypothetical protein
MTQFTPEQRKAIAAKAVATRQANIAKRKAQREEALAYANGLSSKVELLKQTLEKLQAQVAMQELSNKITGKALLQPEQVVKAAIPWHTASGVYFLVDGDEVVYVGQSTNIYNRIPQHHSKKFDRYMYVPCKPELLNALESLYIHCFRPKLNFGSDGVLFSPLTLTKLLEEVAKHDVALPTVPKPKRQRYESAEVQP